MRVTTEKEVVILVSVATSVSGTLDWRRWLVLGPDRPGGANGCPGGIVLDEKLATEGSTVRIPAFEVLDFTHPLERLPSEYFRTNIAITTTGVFSHAALIAAIQEVGVDNVMFSIDYPFESTEKAVQFIRTAPLAPADQA